MSPNFLEVSKNVLKVWREGNNEAKNKEKKDSGTPAREIASLIHKTDFFWGEEGGQIGFVEYSNAIEPREKGLRKQKKSLWHEIKR